MLILSRKVGERIKIAGNIDILVKAILGNRVQIAVEAPKNIRIVRQELASRATPDKTKPIQ